jgi:hypothetical protein
VGIALKMLADFWKPADERNAKLKEQAAASRKLVEKRAKERDLKMSFIKNP